MISMLIAVEYLRVTEKRPLLIAGISSMVRACDELREGCAIGIERQLMRGTNRSQYS